MVKNFAVPANKMKMFDVPERPWYQGRGGTHMRSIEDALKKVSMRTELIAVIIVFSLVPSFLLSALYVSKLNELATARVADYASRVVEQTAASAEALVQEVEIVWKQVVDAAVMTDFLFSPRTEFTPSRADAAYSVENLLRGFRRSFPYIDGIHVIGTYGRVVSSSSSLDIPALVDKPWVRAAWVGPIPGLDARVVTDDYSQMAATRHGRTISVVSRIAPYGEEGNSLVIVIDLNFAAVSRRIEGAPLGPGAVTMVYSDAGRMLLHPDEAVLFSSVMEAAGDRGDDAVLFREGWFESGSEVSISRRVRGLGWVLSTIPTIALTGSSSAPLGLYLAALAALAGLSATLAVLTANRITRPLQNLVRAMGRIGEGDFSSSVEEGGNRECVQLVRSFAGMQAEIGSLMERIALQERETLRAELLSLQFQINPHFLYNTMDVLRGIAYERKALDIARMAESLGNLFRYAKGGGDSGATLRMELERLEDYVEIQRYRFRDRFRFELDVPADCLDAAVLRFMLQPLAENAFQHGIEALERGGLITVSARREGGDLVVRIADNGSGMGAQELERLRTGLAAVMESSNAGIGLANVHNRLRLRFGEGYGLTVDSAPGAGTTVTARMPYGEAPWESR